MARVINEAFHIASTGRPGPVLIDLPKDVMANKAKYVVPEKANLRGYKPNFHGNLKQIERAAKLIDKASRPVIYGGGGIIISGAANELKKLAVNHSIPVTTTLLGMGGFPGTHKLSLGMLGMHGTYAANMAITNCDVLVAIGARFDDRVTGKIEEFAPDATIIHIDIDPSAISKMWWWIFLLSGM